MLIDSVQEERGMAPARKAQLLATRVDQAVSGNGSGFPGTMERS